MPSSSSSITKNWGWWWLVILGCIRALRSSLRARRRRPCTPHGARVQLCLCALALLRFGFLFTRHNYQYSIYVQTSQSIAGRASLGAGARSPSSSRARFFSSPPPSTTTAPSTAKYESEQTCSPGRSPLPSPSPAAGPSASGSSPHRTAMAAVVLSRLMTGMLLPGGAARGRVACVCLSVGRGLSTSMGDRRSGLSALLTNNTHRRQSVPRHAIPHMYLQMIGVPPPAQHLHQGILAVRDVVLKLQAQPHVRPHGIIQRL